MMAFPPHTTSHLSPLDRCVFGPMKRTFNQVCSQFMAGSPNNTVNKWVWPKLFGETYAAKMTQANIKSGFKAAGIFPFDPTAIPSKVFLPAQDLNAVDPGFHQEPSSNAHPLENIKALYRHASQQQTNPMTLPPLTMTLPVPMTLPPPAMTLPAHTTLPAPCTDTAAPKSFPTPVVGTAPGQSAAATSPGSPVSRQIMPAMTLPAPTADTAAPQPFPIPVVGTAPGQSAAATSPGSPVSRQIMPAMTLPAPTADTAAPQPFPIPVVGTAPGQSAAAMSPGSPVSMQIMPAMTLPAPTADTAAPQPFPIPVVGTAPGQSAAATSLGSPVSMQIMPAMTLPAPTTEPYIVSVTPVQSHLATMDTESLDGAVPLEFVYGEGASCITVQDVTWDSDLAAMLSSIEENKARPLSVMVDQQTVNAPMPSTSSLTNRPPSKPSKRVSGHRILTSDAIIEQKRKDVAEKAAKEQRKIERAAKMEQKSS